MVCTPISTGTVPTMRWTFAVLMLAATACTGSSRPVADTAVTQPPIQVLTTTPLPPETSVTTRATLQATSTTVAPFARPDWLGTRLLPLRADGFGQVLATPPELIDRRFETLDLLPPPSGDDFEWSVQPVPQEVLERSS